MNKRDAKKREILVSSIGVMREKGYNGTSIKDLAEAAGIPKGSIYNYFKNKEDYAKEALYYYYYDLNGPNFVVLTDSNVKPLDRITEFYKNKISIYKSHDNWIGCFVGNLTQELGGISNIITETTDEIHRDIAIKIKTNIEEAIADGEMSKVDAEALGEFIVSSWQGSLLRSKTEKDRKNLDIFYKMLVEVLLK